MHSSVESTHHVTTVTIMTMPLSHFQPCLTKIPIQLSKDNIDLQTAEATATRLVVTQHFIPFTSFYVCCLKMITCRRIYLVVIISEQAFSANMCAYVCFAAGAVERNHSTADSVRLLMDNSTTTTSHSPEMHKVECGACDGALLHREMLSPATAPTSVDLQTETENAQWLMFSAANTALFLITYRPILAAIVINRFFIGFVTLCLQWNLQTVNCCILCMSAGTLEHCLAYSLCL